MTLDTRVGAVVALLHRVARDHAPAALASSFGAEDMVLVDLVARHALPIEILTLDTGRLPDETHALIDRARERYRLVARVSAPATLAMNDIGRVHLALAQPAFVDRYADNRTTGSFILIDEATHDTVAAGMIQ